MRMLFWLILVSDGGYNYGTATVHPVPFTDEQQCLSSAAGLAEAAKTLEAFCLPQPASDANAWRKDRYQ